MRVGEGIDRGYRLQIPTSSPISYQNLHVLQEGRSGVSTIGLTVLLDLLIKPLSIKSVDL